VLQAFLGFGFAARFKQKAHAAAGHAAEHPKAPEIVAHFGAHALDQGVRIEVAGPRDDGLDGPVEIASGGSADAAHIAVAQLRQHVIQYAHGFAARQPLLFGAQQVALGDHFQDGAYVLRHPAVHQHQAIAATPGAFRARSPPRRRCDGAAAGSRG
jgi:hypothetical protein